VTVPYVIVARVEALEGHEQEVADVLARLVVASRQEPGCRNYKANRGHEDPKTFLVYEEYIDETAFKAHTSSDHFKQYFERQAAPMLGSVVVEAFDPLHGGGDV
jgi:quinol monooxygenase YgiN